MNDHKLYRIFRVNDRTGAEVEMTSPGLPPLTHHEACTMLQKLNWLDCPYLRNVIREVSNG